MNFKKKVKLDEVQNIIREVAEAEILPRFKNLKSEDIMSKTSADDLVTIADQEAERILTQRLMDYLPGSVVVGEESVSADPEIMNLLRNEDPVWVIDPVDGTHNFVHGNPKFGSMVALIVKGVTTHGWIYNAEKDNFVMAEKGGGAVLPEKNTLPESFTALLGSRKQIPPEYIDRLESNRNIKVINIHASAHHYYEIAIGNVHAVYSIWPHGLNVWDHAPGALISLEAGCYMAHLDGKAYEPTIPNGGAITAASEELYYKALEYGGWKTD